MAADVDVARAGGRALQPAASRRAVAGAQRMPRARRGSKAQRRAPVRTVRVRSRRVLTSRAKVLSQGEAQQRTERLANRYARKHGLEVRVVVTGPEGRAVPRVFVPVLPETFEAFHSMFTAPGGNDSVVLRYTENNRHMAMAVEPGDNYLWARNYNGTGKHPDYRASYMSFNGGGYSIAVHPSAGVAHLRKWLADRANPMDDLFCVGNCMEWLPNAEVAENTPFFFDLGVRRSRDGGNMKAKVLHAGNHRVGVIGVHVSSLADFRTMTDAQLLGPPPAGGIEDAARL